MKMRKMNLTLRRVIALALTLVMTCAMLAGCGGSNGG